MRTEFQKFTVGNLIVEDLTTVFDDYNIKSVVSVSQRTKNGPVYYSHHFDDEATIKDVMHYAKKVPALQRSWIKMGRRVK